MVEVLANISDAWAETVTTASPGVVRVEGRDRVPASGIVWSADGVIATTHHVLDAHNTNRLSLVGKGIGQHVLFLG